MFLAPSHLANCHLFSFQLKMSPPVKSLPWHLMQGSLTGYSRNCPPSQTVIIAQWDRGKLTPRQGARTRSVSPWCLGEHLASSRCSINSCWKLQWHEVKSGTRRALVGLTRRENRQYFGKQKSKLQHLQLIHEVILHGTTLKGHALLHHFAGFLQQLESTQL